MIDDDPSPRSSRDTRHAFTISLAKPGRGSSRYQSKNSCRAMLYTRFVIGDETESSTRLFIRRHSFVFSTTVNSFILCLLLGNIGSHEDLTSGQRRQQAKRLLGLANNWRRHAWTGPGVTLLTLIPKVSVIQRKNCLLTHVVRRILRRSPC